MSCPSTLSSCQSLSFRINKKLTTIRQHKSKHSHVQFLYPIMHGSSLRFQFSSIITSDLLTNSDHSSTKWRTTEWITRVSIFVRMCVYVCIHNAFEADPMSYSNGRFKWSQPESECDPSTASTFRSCLLCNEWDTLQAISAKCSHSTGRQPGNFTQRALFLAWANQRNNKTQLEDSHDKRCSELGSIQDLGHKNRPK